MVPEVADPDEDPALTEVDRVLCALAEEADADVAVVAGDEVLVAGAEVDVAGAEEEDAAAEVGVAEDGAADEARTLERMSNCGVKFATLESWSSEISMV